MRPVQKPKTIRELGPVNITNLKTLVEKVSERIWDGEDSVKENRFDCFQHTRHIIFRFIEGNRDPQDVYSNPIWEPWQGVLSPIMDQATQP
tara:strand:+ start:2022 stop:2294 length:273 start_codon:yes stop_codon:yes gene_type:complete